MDVFTFTVICKMTKLGRKLQKPMTQRRKLLVWYHVERIH